MKALATILYAMGNMSLCGIGRLFGVSDVSVLRWVRKEAEALPEPEVPGDTQLVMLDEMHHFLKKRQTNYGFGEPLILSSGELYPGFWVAVMMGRVGGCSTR
jgi:transposase